MKEWFAKFWAGCKTVWKAIGAGVLAAFAYVFTAGIFSLDLTPWEALVQAWGELGNWSSAQWLGLVIAVLAAYGVVWTIPNIGKPAAE